MAIVKAIGQLIADNISDKLCKRSEENADLSCARLAAFRRSVTDFSKAPDAVESPGAVQLRAP
jgi:glucose-6-phosphate dehydrogenase assembly protein OpcA